MLKEIIKFLLRIRIFYIIFIFLLTLFFTFGILKLKIQGDILKALPPEDPAVELFDKIGELFKGNSIGMVILRGEPDVFNKKTFEKVKELTEKYKTLRGISDVMSLTNIMDIKKIEGGIEVGKLLPEGYIPQTQEEFDSLRNYIFSKERFKGIIVSQDGKYTAIIVRISPEFDRGKVAKEIKEITEKLKGNFEVHYSGLPLQIYFSTQLIKNELYKLTPLAGFVLLSILFIGFGSLRGVILPILTVLISIIWTLGLMGILNIPLSIVSNIMPVILLAVGSAYGIHLINKYYEDVKDEKEKFSQIIDATQKISVPIIMASLTTFFGFLSLLFTQLDPLRKFGIFTSLGVIFSLFLTLTFIPLLLSMLKVKVKMKIPYGEKILKNLHILSRIIINKSKTLLSISLILLLSGIAGIFLIRREVDMVEYFPKNHPIRVSAEIVNKKFGGSIPIYILIESENVKNPVILKTMRNLELIFKNHPYIRNPQSLADLIEEMNDYLIGYRAIPESEEKVNNLFFLLEGQPSVDMLITKDNKKAIIQMVSGTVKSEESKKIAEYIEKILKEIPREYIVVNEDSLEGNLKEKYLREYAKFYSWILSKIRDIKNEDEVNRILYQAKANPDIYYEEIKENAFKKLDEYFLSEESEIIIKDKKKREKVIEEILKEKQIFEILEKNKLLNANVDTNGVISEINNLLKEAKREVITQKISEKLLNYIDGIDFDRLKGIIYEFTGSNLIVPKNENLNSSNSLTLKIKHTGLPLIYKRLDENLLKSQLQSLFLALILVFVMMVIEFRSFTGGILAIIPICYTILIYFGLLGFMKFPLDTATVMIAPIAVGIGIDYTIHVLSRIKRELKENDYEKALEITLSFTGKAVIINALSVGLGFLVLILATLIPLRRFGIMIFITMLLSSLSALILLPILIFIIKPTFLKENLKNKI